MCENQDTSENHTESRELEDVVQFQKRQRESKSPEFILTESEALGLWRLLLRGLAVDRRDVTLLAAVVAAVAAADPAASHRREDDLDAVQAGGQVGPWEAHTHLREEEQQRRTQLAGDELHLPSIRTDCDTLPFWAKGGLFKCVRVCANNWPVASCSRMTDVPRASK